VMFEFNGHFFVGFDIFSCCNVSAFASTIQ